MQKNALFGWAFFIVIAVVGAIFFTNAKKKSDAQAQLDSYKYFASLMAEDQSQTVPNPNGGAPIHPWVLTATPTQTEIEDKVTATRSGDGPSYTWEVTTDPTGGTNPKTFRFVVGFDSQGKMNTLSGLHGTVTTYGGGWLPDTSGG